MGAVLATFLSGQRRMPIQGGTTTPVVRGEEQVQLLVSENFNTSLQLTITPMRNDRYISAIVSAIGVLLLFCIIVLPACAAHGAGSHSGPAQGGMGMV